MQAIRVHQTGDPDVLRLEETPDPRPGPGQVLIRVHAVGVNPVETYVRSGKYPLKASLPYTPGSDAGGVVDTVGRGVTGLRAGERVYTSGSATGTYAELTVSNLNQVHRLPGRCSFPQGAAVGVPYATAYMALFLRAAAKAGETVLVHGASGGVGTAAVQLAKAAGLTILGTAGSEAGLRLVKEQGARHVLNHAEANYLQKVMELTGGKGADVILEMAAHVNLGKALGVLAKYGRLVVVGSRGPVEINPRDLMSRNADVRGMTLMNATEAELATIHGALGKGLEDGTLTPVIGKQFSLADASKAHEAVLEKGSYGKIVLIP